MVFEVELWNRLLTLWVSPNTDHGNGPLRARSAIEVNFKPHHNVALRRFVIGGHIHSGR